MTVTKATALPLTGVIPVSIGAVLSTKNGRVLLLAPNAVVVTVTPVTAGTLVDENGWPESFFDRVAGSMPELRRGSQGQYEERLPLE